MMVICIEMKIPLFLVGKPGSSKSLAKSVVTDVMKGPQSTSDFFRNLRDTFMVSFQCSPLATAEGISETFAQCRKFQEKKAVESSVPFVAVVVLDEVGLAEDSKEMPLKVLHPLLETGTVDDEDGDEAKETQRVAFIGISNWALDPAKMNRGILLSRGEPGEEDLRISAAGICTASGKENQHLMEAAIAQLTKGYVAIRERQEREFFGLRDFYHLVKMLLAIVRKTQKRPSDQDFEFVVRRNFGGYFGG